MSKKKTNAMRMLDAANITYTTKEYPYEESDLSGIHAAQTLGLDENMVFKTLVAKGDKTGPVVFCIPVHKELNLKNAAAVSKNKRVELIHVRDLLDLTGYMRGGCSPIGMKKKFPTFFDQSMAAQETVSISAGIRGCQILLKVKDLRPYVGGKLANLTK